MTDPEPDRSYQAHLAKAQLEHPGDLAFQEAIGGQFAAIGTLEYYLLRDAGMTDDAFVVDVGCGAGRLACRLAALPQLRYLGTDIVPELLDYAARISERPDWKFITTEKFAIPCPAGAADFVCFFSVFTHLQHEDTYRYLAEARRVLQPGGKIIFSFLEFRVPCHWEVFAESLAKVGAGLHLNQFIDRDAIRAWAHQLELEVIQIADGDKPHIPIDEEIVLDNGTRFNGMGNLGQSVAILRKAIPTPDPAAPSANPAAPPRKFFPSLTPIGISSQSGGQLMNISARGRAGPGDDSMIVGFVIGAAGARILARIIGPGLLRARIPNFLPEPLMAVLDAQGTIKASNTGYRYASAEERRTILEAAEKIGASPLDEKDAALVVVLSGGAYSLVIRGPGVTSGIVLAEIFEIPS